MTSDSNLTPNATLADVLRLKEKTGHSTVAITEDGTPFDRLICASEHTTLREANDLIWAYKLNCLPIVNEEERLVSRV